MNLAIDQFDVNMSWYEKYLSAKLLRLYTYIWLLINLILDIGHVWQISLPNLV